MPTIASLIREKLYNSPNGATTQEIAAYCIRNGAVFKTNNIQKKGGCKNQRLFTLPFLCA